MGENFLSKFVFQQLGPFLIVLGLFLIIDIPVILYLNYPMYKAQFERVNKLPGPSGNRVYISAIFAYILLSVGIYFFIVRPELNNNNNNIKYKNIILSGSLLGLIIYGVYNGTNMATINEWGIKESVIDTIWGTLLCGSLSALSLYFSKLVGY
jgi:uncharacterized membrane protein